MARRCGRRRPRRRVWPLLVAAALAGTLAVGCGDSADESPAQATNTVEIQRVPRDRWSWARARFTEMCAGCHTLADAGATGRRFNLDNDPDVDPQLVRETILGGGPGMPPFASSISYREYEQLAAYILAVAGNRGVAPDDGWQWQIRFRQAGEHERPPGWPEKRWLSVPRYNP